MNSHNNKNKGAEVMSSHSVTEWLDQVKHGDSCAAQKIWDRYLNQLLRVAALRLRNSKKEVEDEEDAVVKAFANFLQGASRNRFSRLNDRHDLWQVLVMLTDRRAIEQIRKSTSRRHNLMIGESSLGGASLDKIPLRTVECCEQPEFAAMFADELKYRLGTIRNETIKRIVILKLQCWSTEEIANDVNLSQRSVQRKLDRLKKKWDPNASGDNSSRKGEQ